MLRGDWRYKLTLGLVVALYLVWVAPLARSFIPALEYDPAQYQTRAEREQARNQTDTEAQVWMAWAAWAQVGVGSIGLIGLGFTIIFARNAWLESRAGAIAAQAQADIARQELTQRNRPRLFVSAEHNSLWNARERYRGMDFRLANEGEHTAHIECAWRAYLINIEYRPKPGDATRAAGRHPYLDSEVPLRPGGSIPLQDRVGFDPKVLAILDNPEEGGVVHVLAYVDYRDHLGCPRRYEFCFVSNGPTEFAGEPWDFLVYTDDREREGD